MGSATEIIVVEQKLRALAEFEVLKPDGSHGGFYQASIVVHQGLDVAYGPLRASVRRLGYGNSRSRQLSLGCFCEANALV